MVEELVIFCRVESWGISSVVLRYRYPGSEGLLLSLWGNVMIQLSFCWMGYFCQREDPLQWIGLLWEIWRIGATNRLMTMEVAIKQEAISAASTKAWRAYLASNLPSMIIDQFQAIFWHLEKVFIPNWNEMSDFPWRGKAKFPCFCLISPSEME